jgi:hypothetical protein
MSQGNELIRKEIEILRVLSVFVLILKKLSVALCVTHLLAYFCFVCVHTY